MSYINVIYTYRIEEREYPTLYLHVAVEKPECGSIIKTKYPCKL